MKCQTKSSLTMINFTALIFSLIVSVSARAEDCNPAGTLEERLSCVQGLSFMETTSTVPGYRLFDLQFIQPVDHEDPNSPTFKQHLVLFHASYDAPTILQTSGYAIFGKALTSVASHFNANQIQVEHRFFGSSVPAEKDWSKLNVVQSAADFHRITQALKKVYGKKWVNTGASKGGMTSVFHRRYYPDDLDGTLALVAPLSYARADDRYIDFVDKVGGPKYAKCRTDLEEFQRTLLRNRSSMVSRLEGEYETLGGADVAFEHAVYEVPFAFWQYGRPTSATAGCSKIPAADAGSDDLFSFLSVVNDVEKSYSDEGMKPFVPYFVQAAHQLGGPAAKISHLGSLALHQDSYNLGSYIPAEAERGFDSAAMPDIQNWVNRESKSIMFIYGEFDPWSAGAYDPGDKTRDNFLYIAPKENHRANVQFLTTSQQKQAWKTLGRWLNVAETSSMRPFSRALESLEDIEFKRLSGQK